MKKRFSHIPVIPLGLDKEDISINKELIVDYDTNNIYLFNDNGIKPDDLITTIQKRLQEDRRHEIISPDQKKIYGVDINLNESDPTLSARYVQDATGYKNFYIDQTTGEIDYGSWKDLLTDFFGIEPVLMENGKEVLKINPEDYDRILDNPVTDKFIYGFELDLRTGKVKYTDKSVGNVPMTVTDTDHNYGSWKSFLIDFIGIKPTALKDVIDEKYDIDPNHYNVKISQDYIEDDHIMIRFLHNYYKIDYNKDRLIFKVANYKPDNTYTDDIFIDGKPMYMGAYEGIESKSGEIINPDSDEDLNTLLLGKRYFYVFCLGIMISRTLEMENLGYYKYTHYDNNTEYDSDKVVYTRESGVTDHDGFFTAQDRSVKTLGAENVFGNGGQNNVGVFADGGKLILEIDTSSADPIKIERCIHLENRLLDYRCRKDKNINLAFGAGDAIIQISMPSRLFM